ncbi:MAG: hydrolase 76 protein [Thelocarpon impressellum]|nr:MAG: hydrolase 76 protein [Thelocarpon impressellum]
MKFSSSGPQSWTAVLVSSLLLRGQVAQAIDLKIDDPNSVKAAAKKVAYGMMTSYTGNRSGDVPGNLPQPYYWWECGAMFGSLVDYWYYTNDTTYNEVVTQGLLFQVGPNNDFMPPNQTKTEGNDDQAFWAMAAMSAAENKFPNPPDDKPQWLALAQAVFNQQASRWDDKTCNGGLRWQIYTFNNGYNYKNTISNGCFFNIAARLARYTGNTTYSDWAEKMWDWTAAVGIMDPEFKFYDGTDAAINCSGVNHIQWSYSAGVYLLGAASMYNVTNGSEKWRARVEGILKATSVFFTEQPPNVMYEVACEPNGKCNVDQRSFKAYLSQWMAHTTQMAPFTADFIMPRLKASAVAAAQQCSGAGGELCGVKWTMGTNDGSPGGVGEQMSALSVIGATLIPQVEAPATNSTGGISKGNSAAGGAVATPPSGVRTEKVTTGDRVGAGFLTTFILVGVLGGAWWMVV